MLSKMKQYTNREQTTKLIELGFDKPKLLYFGNVILGNPSYTIGELMEMLPKTIENGLLADNLSIYTICNGYQVEYSNVLGETYFSFNVELIDALYDMLIKLKEEGIIKNVKKYKNK